MVQWFPTAEKWALKNSEGYLMWQLFEKINLQGKKNYLFKVLAPVSLANCPSPLDVEFYWTQCVKGNYHRMEPIPIGGK